MSSKGTGGGRGQGMDKLEIRRRLGKRSFVLLYEFGVNMCYN